MIKNELLNVTIKIIRTKFIEKDVFLWTKKRMKLFYLKTKE